MVHGVRIQEGQQITSGRGINNLINERQGESVFWTCFVQVREINVEPPFYFGLLAARELFDTFQAQPSFQPPKSPLSFLAKIGPAVYSAY